MQTGQSNIEVSLAASSGQEPVESHPASVGQNDANTTSSEDCKVEEGESMLPSLHQKSPTEALQEAETYLNRCQAVTLDIGVIGRSGSGKSSFINAVRDLRPRMPGAAAVGPTETTEKAMYYEHPRNPNVKFWDLPGVGTPKFPKNTYLEQVDITGYEFFIIISSTRFTEDDIWLAEEIRRSGRSFYFVRTKIDEDIRNYNEDYGHGSHVEDELLSEIRNDCENNLVRNNLPNVPVFLISSKNRLKFEFAKLEKEYMNNLPELKREVALFSSACKSAAVIEEKAKLLLERSKVAAIKCSLAASVPVPSLAFKVDMSVLKAEIGLYKGILGLDSDDLDQLSESSGIQRAKFQMRVNRHEWNRCSDEDIVSLLKARAPEYNIKNIISSVPLLGSVAGPILAYRVARKVLVCVIESMRKEALEVAALATGRTEN